MGAGTEKHIFNSYVVLCMPCETQDDGAIIYRAGAYTWESASPRLVSAVSPVQAAQYGISMPRWDAVDSRIRFTFFAALPPGFWSISPYHDLTQTDGHYYHRHCFLLKSRALSEFKLGFQAPPIMKRLDFSPELHFRRGPTNSDYHIATQRVSF